MSQYATCGKECSITIDSGTYRAHSFTLTINGKEIDVTAFGDGTFGQYEVCGADGTITANLYKFPMESLSIGDDVDVDMTFGDDEAVNVAADGVIQSMSANVDAKGIAEFTVTVRLTGSLTIDNESSDSESSASSATT